MEAPRLGLVGRTGARAAEWELSPDLRAPGRARELTRGELAAWDLADQADIDEIVLMVDELVANAVVHGKGPIHLSLLLEGMLLRGEITDESFTQPPRARTERETDAEDGRGLMLVAALSADSGCRNEQHGKTVWFTRMLSGLAS